MPSQNSKDPSYSWNLEFEQMQKDWEKRFAELVVPERHLRKIHLEIDKLALKYGWVSDWGHFTPAEIYDQLQEWSDPKISIEVQERTISHYFVNYYSASNFRELEEMVTKWIENLIFQRRKMIFQDFLGALRNTSESFNPSNLIVPVLISQIDGIIGEVLEREGYSYAEIETKKGRKEKRWVNRDDPMRENAEKNSENCFGKIIKNKRNRFGPTGFSNLIQMNSRYEVLIEGLFQSAFHGNMLKNPSFPSRHKILHREEVGYGTLKNVIKLFLILDYLSEFSVSNLTDPDDSGLVEYRKLSSIGDNRNGPSGVRGFSSNPWGSSSNSMINWGNR